MENMNVKNITLDGSDDKKQKFCNAWPAVKTGLQLLADIVKNPIAKAAVNVVITAGDTIAKSICG